MRIKPWWVALTAVSIVLSLGACARKLPPEPSCGFLQNGESLRVAWKNLAPMKLYVHQSVPVALYPELEPLLRGAIDVWNQAAGRELIRLQAFGVGGSQAPQKDGYSVLYWMNTWEPERASEQARTTIYWTGNQAIEADIRVNSKNFTLHVQQGGPVMGVDFKSLMIHELGHALGLTHDTQELVPSVMKVSLGNGELRRSLSPLDVANLHCEY